MNAPHEDYESTLATMSPASAECSGPERCSDCSWSVQNGGYCSGCDDEYQQRCLKRICNSDCYTCSGGRHAYTPGCCGHAPSHWRKRWDRLLEYSMPDYAPDPLPIKCRLIPLIHSISKYRIPEQFPQIDAWAFPIHKVGSPLGKFPSKDLKDYLSIPPDRKLIMSTCCPDSYEEMLWKKRSQMDYEKHGIDYWFPAHFSIYDDDSKMYQFASARRQQLHAVWTQSQFVWFRLGESIPVEFLAPIQSASSVLISTNQMYSKRNRAILHNEVQLADRWFPETTAFFVVGGSKSLPITSERTCFEINSNWLIKGIRGRNLARQKEEKLSTREILAKNLKEVVEDVHPGID